MLNRISVILFFVLSNAGFLFCNVSGDSVLAQVGFHTITASDFSRQYSDFLFHTNVKDNLAARESVLNNMINEILLYYYGDDNKFINDPEYNEELEENKKRTILAYLKDREIYSKITVTEAEAREAFRRVNEKLAVRHLYAKTEEEADNLYDLLKLGTDFNTLAKQVFTDSTLKNNGGYLGYFTWGDLDPAFEDTAYSLKVGEISKPVKTANGYSIIKLEDRISNPLLTESDFQNRKSHIEDVIRMRKKDPAEKKYLQSIFDENQLRFNDKALENILYDLYSSGIKEAGKIISESRECVTYKDKIYTQTDIEKKLSDLPSYHRKRINSIEDLHQAIEGMFLNDILYKTAVSKGYDTVMVVLKKIEQYNKNTLLKYKKQDIITSAQLPDSVLYKYYTNNISLFTNEPEMNLQEILVSDEDIANKIINMINEGNDFGELAKKFSVRKWSAENNGIIGFSPASKFGNYRDLFWNSKVGETIGPIKIEGIYGIFRLLGKEESKPMAFDEVKDEVIKESQFENQTEILQKYLNDIRSKVNVRINENLLYSVVIAGLI